MEEHVAKLQEQLQEHELKLYETEQRISRRDNTLVILEKEKLKLSNDLNLLVQELSNCQSNLAQS